MNEQLDRIEASILTNIRNVCDGLARDVSAELQTLEKHASKLDEYEREKERADEPQCTLQEHASKLEDYKDLQGQHQLTLEMCELLRKQNIRLQREVKDLLENQSRPAPSEDLPVVTQPNRNSPRKPASSHLSSNAQKWIEDHPELQAAMTAQSRDYKKLQKAHTILLGKLKEQQKVIEQLHGGSTLTEARHQEDKAQLAHLQEVIGGANRSSRSPAFSVSTSPSRPAKSNTPSSGPGRTRTPTVEQDNGNETAIAVPSSSLPKSSAETHEAERVSTPSSAHKAATPVLSSGALPTNESQPEFVSERPVKRRRTIAQRSHDPVGPYVKAEPKTPDHRQYDDHQASIDLDAVHAPILPSAQSSRASERSKSTKAINPGNSNHTQRHSEPPPDSVDVVASDPLSAAKSASFTSDGLGRGRANVDGERSDATTHTARLLETCKILHGTAPRPILKPRNPNEQVGNQAVLAALDRLKETAAGAVKRGRSRVDVTPKKRLREKDIEELSVSDFRLNPSMNRGFNQTIGGQPLIHQSRNCDEDCSKPECCGSAFALAIRKAGIVSIEEIPNRDRNSVISRYLGFPVYRLGNISREKYQDLLGQAIGKQFAEKYGKHQQVRADSPPGYWRVEFPATQDRIADEEKANELERIAVKNRRREALREGGLWVFRDE